jgi:tRNA (guanine-N7-)-methyltransferase
MGRRALPKVDPNIDLSPYLLSCQQLSDPWDADGLFCRSAPVELEVGSGKGLFVVTAASQAADRNFVGIEISGKYARFAAARLARRALSNAKMVHGDARWLFAERLSDVSLAAVHVYFPDPWWKKRHHKRRIMTPDFLANVQRVLTPGGRFHFWTDVREYFQLSLRQVADTTRLSKPRFVAPRAAAHNLDYQTHFERRMRLHNQPIYRAEFTKEHHDE